MVTRPKLFLTAAIMKTQKKVCERWLKNIGQIKWPEKIGRVHTRRRWFLIFFFALAAMLIL